MSVGSTMPQRDQRLSIPAAIWKKSDWMALSGILFFSAVLRLVFFTGFFGSDDITYTEQALAIANGNWNIPKYLGSLRYGFNLPNALFISILGPSAFAVNLWALTCSVGEIGLVFLIARGLWGLRAAVFSAMLLGLTPLHVHFAGRIMADAPLAFFITLSFFSLLLAESRHSALLYFAAGLAVGSVFWIKEVVLVYGGVFLIYAVLQKSWHVGWLWMILGFAVMFAANALFFLSLTGDPFYYFRVIVDRQNVAESVIAAGDSDYLTPVWFYFKYLFLDIRHTWIMPYLAAAGIVAWIRGSRLKSSVDRGTQYVIIWGLGLLLIFTFLPIKLSPLTFIFKQTNYMLIFLAPFALVAGFFLARLRRGLNLVLILTAVISGSVVLSGLEQQAIRVFTANSKAALLFAGEHPDDSVYGTQHAAHMSRVFPQIKIQRDLPPIVKAISEILPVGGSEIADRNGAQGNASIAYAVVDMETIKWGKNPSLDLEHVPGCWQRLTRLTPVGLGYGSKIVRVLVATSNGLPSIVGNRISARLDALINPLPAYVYRINRPCAS